MIIQTPGFSITDRFDKEWALETRGLAIMIFDLIWIIVISRFPKIANILKDKGLNLEYPIVTLVLTELSKNNEENK